MMETTTLKSIWQSGKLIVKGFIIAVLVLLLLIPAHYVQNLVEERESRQQEAVSEVSSKWAEAQNLTGPVLVIPYEEKTVNAEGKPVTYRLHAYFLPDKLNIAAEVNPEKKYRGIYKVILYSSFIRMSGKFLPLPLQALKINTGDLLLNEAYVCMGISDARGLREEVMLKWNNTMLGLIPSAVNNAVFKEGFTATLNLTEEDLMKEITFAAEIRLNGSEQLLFTPVGKETNVKMQSAWPDPSFTGGQLPLSSSINDNGFTADWKSLSHTRSFPQLWKDGKYDLSTASFGASLFIPVNEYQKTMRSVKYAILCIILTFTAFFLIETVHKRSVHPVQYALIGFALILFYTLLLSFSEYIGFNTAYGLAALATTGLISWFVKGLLGSSKLSLLLSVVLIIMYSWLFTILQLQDYALLLGSIGLFLTLTIVMYFSRRVQW
jgi:inner membrane protein